MTDANLIQDTLPSEMIETAPAVASPSQAAVAVEPVPAPVAGTPAPIYVGGKKFENNDQMLSYFSELEAQRMAAQVPQHRIADEAPIEKELSTLLYEDPAAYTKAVMEQTRRDMRREMDAEKQQVSAWDTFYAKNPDLQQDKDLVGMMHSMLAPKLNSMHLDQAVDELAKATRLRLNKLRQIPQGEGKQLHSGPAVTTGATGGPVAQPAGTHKPMTMADQIFAMRQKRSKRA